MGDGGGSASREYEVFDREPVAPAMDRALGPSPREVLLDVLLDPDPDRSLRGLRRIVARGADRFVRVALPEAARRLGEMWLDDRVGFAEVTVATARLQAVLRDLDPGMDHPDAPLVALVVPEGETHTLGAAVAAWRLRRAGASVMLLIGRPEHELLSALGGGDLSAVCLSTSNGGDGTALAPLVGRLRVASGAPVVLGGAVLDGQDVEAVRCACGADRVTAEPEDVLALAREQGP